MEITFYLTNQSKKFQDINDRFIDLSNHYVNSLLHFFKYKIDIWIFKNNRRGRRPSFLFEKGNRMNVIKYIYIYVYDVDK